MSSSPFGALCVVTPLVGLGMVSGCYDPVTASSNAPVQQYNGGATNPGPGGGGGGGGGPGGEGSFDPGPGPGPSGGPGDGSMNSHLDAHFIVEDGSSITLSGTISCSEAVTGNIQLDFLQVDASGQRKIVHGVQISSLGAWSELAPKDFGPLYIMAFADNDSNGPSASDPKAVAGPIELGAASIEGIDLVLSQTADMGRLALSGSGEGPVGGAPPEGGPGGNPEPAPEGAPGGDPAGGVEPGAPPTDGPIAPDAAAPADGAGTPGEAAGAGAPTPGPNGEVGDFQTDAEAD